FFKRQSVWDDAHIAGTRPHICRKTKHSEAKHPVSRCHMGNSTSNGLHHAGYFVAEHPGIPRFCRIKGKRLEHITKIYTSGLHFDHHLTSTAGRQGEGHQAQRAEKSALAGFKSNRHRATKHLLSWQQTATDAPDIACLSPEGDLAFGIFLTQLVPKHDFIR